MHVVLNALPVQPGGGLTVVQGLVHGLLHARPDWRVSVFTAHRRTRDPLQSVDPRVTLFHKEHLGSQAKALLWQNARLGREAERIGGTALLTINHHLARVRLPQIVYHLNLRRFTPQFRTAGLADRLKEGLRDYLAQRALTCATANIFESKYLLEAAAQSCRSAIHAPDVVYIGLPERLLNLARTAPNDASSASRTLAAISSAEPHKDNPTLLRAFAELCGRRAGEPWRLEIAGGLDDAAWAPCKRLAAELGIAERITWHGFCSQDKLTGILRRALCLVSASQLESFAMVPLEAMARGCPAVVADCSSMPESVGDAGLLAEPGCPVSFADAVERTADDLAFHSRLSNAGREWVQRFRWEDCGERFAQVLERSTAHLRVAGAA